MNFFHCPLNALIGNFVFRGRFLCDPTKYVENMELILIRNVFFIRNYIKETAIQPYDRVEWIPRG